MAVLFSTVISVIPAGQAAYYAANHNTDAAIGCGVLYGVGHFLLLCMAKLPRVGDVEQRVLTDVAGER